MLHQTLMIVTGACRDGAHCLFDPELHDGPADGVESVQERAAREQVAREVCGSCPVWEQCIDYAVRVRPERGVWAGFTAVELATFLDADAQANSYGTGRPCLCQETGRPVAPTTINPSERSITHHE